MILITSAQILRRQRANLLLPTTVFFSNSCPHSGQTHLPTPHCFPFKGPHFESGGLWPVNCNNKGWVIVCSIMKSILLVEDSRFLRLATEQTLIRAGYSVLTASDGEEALRIAYTMIPDLILLDMLLPKLGGAEVLEGLKKSPLTARIPVIVLSSLSQKNEAKLKKVGAVAYFEKSKLELDQNSESLLHSVKKTLEAEAEPDARESKLTFIGPTVRTELKQ